MSEKTANLDNVSTASGQSNKSCKSREYGFDVIDGVKKRFLEEYEAKKDLYDEEDIERIKKNDFFTRRFVNFNGQGPEKGFEQMKKAYRWRKSFGVNHFDPLVIPKELYTMGAMFSYPPDKEGNLMLYIRGKMHRKVEIIYERMKQYIVYQLNKLDLKQARERSWCVVIDASDTGYDNADLHMLLFFFEVLRNYFPMGIKYYIIYGMPWILNAFATFMLQMMPGFAKNKIKFWGPKELQNQVDEKVLPDFLGGTCKECYKRVPKDAMDIYFLAKRDFDMNEEEVDKLLKPSLKYLDMDNYVEVDQP